MDKLVLSEHLFLYQLNHFIRETAYYKAFYTVFLSMSDENNLLSVLNQDILRLCCIRAFFSLVETMRTLYRNCSTYRLDEMTTLYAYPYIYPDQIECFMREALILENEKSEIFYLYPSSSVVTSIPVELRNLFHPLYLFSLCIGVVLLNIYLSLVDLANYLRTLC